MSTSKNIYNENEQIFFDAQLYNDNYEVINEPDVFLAIENEENNEYKYTFNRVKNYYSLAVGMLPPGKYSYVAKTNYNGQPLEQKGSFVVKKIQLELYDLTARHDLLRSITDKYGGQFFLPTQVNTLGETILANQNIKPVVYPSSKTKSVINFKWLFAFILFFLCIEWFLRRYFGSY